MSDYPQPYPPQPQYNQPYQAAAPQQTNPLAMTSFICALVSPASWLLSLVPLLGSVLSVLAPISAILAVIFGHIALSQIKRRGGSGRGLALAGVIIGYVLILFSIVMFIILALVAAALFAGFSAM